MLGLTLDVLAEFGGLKSKWEVKKYLNSTNQYDLWKSHCQMQGKSGGTGGTGRGGDRPGTRTGGAGDDGRAGTGKVGRPKIGHARNPKIDELVPQGLTLEMMHEMVGLSKERVRQYLKLSGQHDLWKTARKESLAKGVPGESEKNEVIGDLVGLITQIAYSRASEAERKTYEYLTGGRRSRRMSWEKLTSLFDEYFRLKDSKEKVSLKGLEKESGISFTQVGMILRAVNLEPLHGKRERHITPEWKKQAIRRAFNLDVNTFDLAYFLELPNHVVYQNLRMMGDRPLRPVFITEPPPESCFPVLNYRLASQVYEARDAGFTIEETVELLDTRKRVVDYLLEKENIVSSKIVEILGVLYPDEKITTPYVQTAKK